MPRHTYHKKQKRASIVAFFLFAVSVVAILPIAFSIIAQEPEVGSAVLVPIELQMNDVPRNPAIAPKPVQTIPQAHLKIPKIGVDAVIKEMGVTPEGAMAVPSNRVDVGWYSLGTYPGETGSAVIGAHSLLDSMAGVFAHLDQLQKGGCRVRRGCERNCNILRCPGYAYL